MENKVNVYSIALKWGAIFGLMMIIMGLLVYMLDMYESNNAFGLVQMVLFLGALYLAFGEYKAQNEGFMSFGQGMGLSFLVMTISILIANTFSYVHMAIIDPDIVQRIIDIQMIEWEKQNLSDEQIDQALNFMTPGIMMIFATVFQFLLGTLVCLATSYFLKKDRPVQF